MANCFVYYCDTSLCSDFPLALPLMLVVCTDNFHWTRNNQSLYWQRTSLTTNQLTIYLQLVSRVAQTTCRITPSSEQVSQSCPQEEGVAHKVPSRPIRIGIAVRPDTVRDARVESPANFRADERNRRLDHRSTLSELYP
jgi:hypothetical protein